MEWLQSRLRAIINANPWLAGKLYRRSPEDGFGGDVCVFYFSLGAIWGMLDDTNDTRIQCISTSNLYLTHQQCRFWGVEPQ